MPGVLAALVLDVRADHADLSPPPAPPPHHPDATRQVNLATKCRRTQYSEKTPISGVSFFKALISAFTIIIIDKWFIFNTREGTSTTYYENYVDTFPSGGCSSSSRSEASPPPTWRPARVSSATATSATGSCSTSSARTQTPTSSDIS